MCDCAPSKLVLNIYEDVQLSDPAPLEQIFPVVLRLLVGKISEHCYHVRTFEKAIDMAAGFSGRPNLLAMRIESCDGEILMDSVALDQSLKDRQLSG